MSISVLVVDDSALIRQLLGAMITSTPGFTLVGTANDAYQARDLVNQHSPDVITLDIEMPRMDGLSFLQRLMKARPTPVVMISTLTEHGADATLKALELGAVDFIPKPKIDIASGIESYREELIDKLRAAAKTKPRLKPRPASSGSTIAPNARLSVAGTEHILAIGASTGGTEAIRELLEAFPLTMPGIVVTQHMPPGFTRSFAQRLDRLSKLRVSEAREGERILPGHVCIAPGGVHLLVKRSGADLVCHLSDAPPVSRHKPSVDVLFDSVAEVCGASATGVILTGMGKDGASGLNAMHRQGARTFAQDEKSCVVFGMPRVAIEMGGVDVVAALSELPGFIVSHLQTVCRGNRV